MDPRMIPKGSGPEYNSSDEGQRPDNQPGVYFHPQAGKFVETAGQRRPDGSMAYSIDGGKVQADAFTQIGYRPASKEELKQYNAEQAAKREMARIKASRTTTILSKR
jgi:hypothetical protein